MKFHNYIPPQMKPEVKKQIKKNYPVSFGHAQPLKNHPSGWVVIRGTPKDDQGKRIDKSI